MSAQIIDPIENDTAAQIAEFYLESGGIELFNQVFQDSAEELLLAEDEVVAGDFVSAKARIDNLLAMYPLYELAWVHAQIDPGNANWLNPSLYPNVVMLEEITRVGAGDHAETSQPIVLTIIVMTCIHGNRPVDAELSAWEPFTGTIDPQITDNDYFVIRQALQVFQLYVWAQTDGERHLDLRFHEPEGCVDIETGLPSPLWSPPAERAGEIIDELPTDIYQKSDLFYMIYPTSRIDGSGSGGNKRYESERRNMWILMQDDQGFLNKSTDPESGKYQDVRRRFRFTPWYQHEYMHNMGGQYTQYRIENPAHSWYNVGAWPDDYEGQFESAYFSQAINYRINNSPSPFQEGMSKALIWEPDPSACNITVFNDPNHSGIQYVLEIGTHGQPRFRDGHMSSILIPDGLTVTACDDVDGSGSCSVFTTSQATLGALDNAISYIDVAGSCDMGLSSSVVPNRLQAESFTIQSGTQVITGTDGIWRDSLGSISINDSSTYEIDVITAGTVDVTARVSSGNVDGGAINFVLDGANIGSIDVPYTGGWTEAQYFQEITTTLNLPTVGSNQTLVLEYDSTPTELMPGILNLALNKPTNQISTLYNGWSRRAVDGSTDGAWNQSSTTWTGSGTDEEPAWWDVDLEEVGYITEIKLWNRTDCCTGGLNNVHLFVSETPFTGTTLESSLNQATAHAYYTAGELPRETAIAVNKMGRYVRVQLSGVGGLNLSEVEVFGQEYRQDDVFMLNWVEFGLVKPSVVNLALNKPTNQSSTSHNGWSRRAVNGDTNGVWNKNSATHAGNVTDEEPAWWEVDLGEVGFITDVKLWNRTDHASDWLKDVHLFVSDTPFNDTTLESNKMQGSVYEYYTGGQLSRETTVSVNRMGRYVRVQLKGTGALSLAEVEVFGVSDPKGEVGNVTFAQANANQWRTVTLENSYDNPVVVMGPPTYRGDDPAVMRVRNVATNSFQFQLDEWDYRDGGHTTETASYMVVESGTHTLADGTQLVAGRLDGVDTDWETASFGNAFTAAPVLLSQAATTNEAAAVTTRQTSVTATQALIRLQEEEGADGIHAGEQVHWIAIERGVSNASFATGATGNTVTDAWSTINFGQNMDSSSAFLAAMQTFDGVDTAALRYRNLGTSNVEVFVQEELSSDSEFAHTTEVVGYIVFGQVGVIR